MARSRDELWRLREKAAQEFADVKHEAGKGINNRNFAQRKAQVDAAFAKAKKTIDALDQEAKQQKR